MQADTVGIVLFSAFWLVYFFTSQKLYSSRYFYILTLLLLLVCTITFYALKCFYGHPGLQYIVFLYVYYNLWLLIIKLSYQRINAFLISKRWMGEAFAEKDYTYVTHAYNGLGKDIWDEKRAAKPSWLDYILSYALLLLPIWMVILTVKILKGD
jgi:hypothetical protein